MLFQYIMINSGFLLGGWSVPCFLGRLHKRRIIKICPQLLLPILVGDLYHRVYSFALNRLSIITHGDALYKKHRIFLLAIDLMIKGYELFNGPPSLRGSPDNHADTVFLHGSRHDFGG